MPVATPQQYAAMLDAAQAGDYAYPAINVTSLVTINAALKAFQDNRSDGIIQVSTGGGEFASGLNVKDAVEGAIVLAEAAHRLAERYDVFVGLHTDHCQPGLTDEFVANWVKSQAEQLDCQPTSEGRLPEPHAGRDKYKWLAGTSSSNKVDAFLKPLIKETARRRAAGLSNLFQSHMLDASGLPLDLNLKLSRQILELCSENEIILEVEAGVVGGEEDGVDHSDQPSEKLYTSPEDMVAVYEALNGLGRYMFAATFGNVHGSYKPGAVKLRPEILRDGQAAVIDKYGDESRFDLVFHGGSGTPTAQIQETLEYGVVKMNIDTDTQYAFTRKIVDHVMTNYAGVLKVDGDIGVKKAYDPRTYLKLAEAGVAERLGDACNDLRSTGNTICGQV